ncbi:MATE family efflux transporter [Parasalinivibrio latis]|uniref:MATE family efflux transporter n=1 Tax=Parasalinivibrio latis TaxID=2952610 RepID=UPI0030E07B4C
MEAINKKESISRTFWRFTIPAIATMLVNGLYQIVDGVFVGHYMGQEGLAAINIAWPVISVLGGVGLMIGMGAGSLVSTFRGMRQSSKARQAMGTGLLLILLVGALCSAFLYAFGPALLALQGADGVVGLYAVEYVAVFFWGACLTVGAGAIPFLVRNDDAPNMATGLMALGAVTNIVLDYVFIGILGWGLEGAAVATVSAQAVVVVIGIAYFFTDYSALEMRLKDVTLDVVKMREILVLGSSCLVMYLYTGFMVAIHNRLFMDYGSATWVAAYAIVGYLMTLYYLLAQGIAEGMQPPVSYFFGENSAVKVGKTVWLACKVTTVLGLAWIVTLNLFPESLIGWFNSSNPELTDAATLGIRLHLFNMFLDGLIVVSSVYFVSVGLGGVAFAISLGNMVVQLPFLWFLPKWFGLEGVWLAMPLSNFFLAAVALIAMYRHVKGGKVIPPLKSSMISA